MAAWGFNWCFDSLETSTIRSHSPAPHVNCHFDWTNNRPRQYILWTSALSSTVCIVPHLNILRPRAITRTGSWNQVNAMALYYYSLGEAMSTYRRRSVYFYAVTDTSTAKFKPCSTVRRDSCLDCYEACIHAVSIELDFLNVSLHLCLETQMSIPRSRGWQDSFESNIQLLEIKVLTTSLHGRRGFTLQLWWLKILIKHVWVEYSI